MAEHMLTTLDNPYSPFTQFSKWYQYDEEHGYGTCTLLSKFATTSVNFSDEENEELEEKAVREIVDLDPLGIYIAVTKSTPIHAIPLPHLFGDKEDDASEETLAHPAPSQIKSDPSEKEKGSM